MSINSLIFLFLSNSIPLWRDKSILYSRASATILLISGFIPLWLEWSMTHFCILVLLTLGALISLLLIYDSSNKEFYYNGDMLAVFTGYYLSLVEKTIAHSAFNDTFLSINITIGLSMIIIGLLNSKKSISIKDKFLFIMKNKEKLFIFGLAMLLVIFTINMLLSLLGLGVTVDTSSLTLFLYTFFPKVISIKLILILIFCSITKEFKLDNVSLSLSSVIFMVLLGSVNYYYVMPYVKFIMFLGLTKLDNILTRICLLVENSAIKANYTQSLAEGLYNIITKFPIIGRYLYSFRTNNYNYNLSSPFRLSYNGLIKNKMNIYLLTKISKFTRIDIATIVENKVELSYSYKGNISNLEVLLKNNSLYLIGLISNFVSNYSNLTCKINLRCADQIVSINTTFKNGHLEEFNLNRTNLNFANKVDKKAVSNINFLNSKWNRQFSKDLFDICPKYRDSFYDPSEDRTRELLRLTDPSKNGYNLQLFMQQGFSNYGYNIQQGESSTSTWDPYNLNRGIKRPLESENKDIDESTGIYKNYPCIEIKMIKLEDKDFIFLSFDSAKLSTERDRYLDEICFIGRTVLLEHYSSLIENSMEVYRIVDNYRFEDISISEYIDKGYLDLYNAFIAKNKDIIESNGISYNEIYPFSKLYFEGNLDYSEDYYSDYSSSTEDYTEVGQRDLKEFEPAEIDTLINSLRSKQEKFLHKKGVGNNSIRCKLSDIGFTLLNGVVSEQGSENPENEITYMLTKLIKVKPDWFPKSIYPHHILAISVNTLCSQLRKLTKENLINDLTEENILMLTKELKSRMQKLFTDRQSEGDLAKGCKFKDINIKLIKGVIVEGTDYRENEFTQLLGILMDKKPDFFRVMNTKTYIADTSIKNLYYKLSDLIRKPLTKEEITFLINGLESRKAKLFEYREYTANKDKYCNLTDFILTRGEIIIEQDADLAEYEFTRLLENLYKQKPDFFPKRDMKECSVDALIKDLRTFVEN